MTTTAVLLAAGLGTRMKSALPKAMHPIAGRPMLQHLIASATAVFDRVVVVVGPGMEALERLAAPHATVVQQERLGTAHAALQAVPHFGDGDVAVLYADNPLIRPETLRRLLTARQGAGLAMLAMRPQDPGRYGRVIVDGACVQRIVEWADASEAERAVGLCNAGVFCAPATDLVRWLQGVKPSAKGEYYLTDCVSAAVQDGKTVVAVEADAAELRGDQLAGGAGRGGGRPCRAGLRRAAMEGGRYPDRPGTA